MIVLGIDPGSHHCGYGVVAREGSRLLVVESGVIEPGDLPLASRLSVILSQLEAVVTRTRPVEAAVEQVHSGPSPRSALVLGQARGVALAAAGRGGLPVFEYQPSEVKLSFTGSGRAGKEQMIRTARQLLGVEAERSDEADALAVAVCHLARRVARIAVDPKRAADALARMRPARRDHRRG
jgi:crossover junction endodeoxyribonuclease RuvC